MVETADKFEYSFCLPSEGERVLVHFVADRPDLVATVGTACFKEWQDAIVNDFNIHSAEEYTQDILDRKMNTESPFVLVAHTEQVSQGNPSPIGDLILEVYREVYLGSRHTWIRAEIGGRSCMGSPTASTASDNHPVSLVSPCLSFACH